MTSIISLASRSTPANRPMAIVTMPPYAPYMQEVLRHPAVSGIRLNTVMPTTEPLEELLKRMNGLTQAAGGKDLWIDLKGRQLRVDGYWVPPYTEVRLSHKIHVRTPVEAIFGGGKETATVVGVDGYRLIMLDGPRRVVGPGEAVNIISPSLSIEGYLTDGDKRYLEAGAKAGIRNYMLSFVEGSEDTKALEPYLRDANVVAKIESRKGIGYVEDGWDGRSRLMAARGDLYVELEKPHQIIQALETIISKDKSAIAASRIFESLSGSLEPTCADIGDVDNLMRMGYRGFMFGDEICMRRDSIISGLNLFEKMSVRYA
jgi:hypothetical protein